MLYQENEQKKLKLKPFPGKNIQSDPLLSFEEQSKIPNSFVQKLLQTKKSMTLQFNAMIQRHLAYYHQLARQRAAYRAKLKSKLKLRRRKSFHQSYYLEQYAYCKQLLRNLSKHISDSSKSFVALFTAMHHAMMTMLEKLVGSVLAPVLKLVNNFQESVKHAKILIEDFLTDKLQKGYFLLYKKPHPKLKPAPKPAHLHYLLDPNLDIALKLTLHALQVQQLLSEPRVFYKMRQDKTSDDITLNPLAASITNDYLVLTKRIEVDSDDKIAPNNESNSAMPSPRYRPHFEVYRRPRPQ